jgi:hypothetical protein
MQELSDRTGKLKAFEVEINGKVIMLRDNFNPVHKNLDIRQWRYE